MLHFKLLFSFPQKEKCIKFFALLSFLTWCTSVYGGSFTWKNDAASSEWEDPQNWSGTTAVPVNGSNQVEFTSVDNIIIVSSTNAPELSSNQTIGTFTVTSGTLIINSGSVLNVTSTTNVGGGTSINGSGQLSIVTPLNIGVIIGNATSGANINCSINGNIGGSLTLRNSVFGTNTTTIFKAKSGAIGGNIFNGVTTFEAAGIGAIDLRLSDWAADQFNNDLTLISTNAIVYTSYNFDTQYNGNIVVKSTSGGVSFGNNGSMYTTSTLANGKTITAQNFTAGTLTFKNFRQTGASTPQVISLEGSARCLFFTGTGGVDPGPQTIFESDVTVTSPIITLNGAKFKENASFNASSTTTCTGGNIYEKTVSFNFNNTNVNGYWTFGGVDQYLGDVTFVNNNVGIIYVGNGAATFGGNATFDNKSTGSIVLAFANNAEINFTNPLAKAKFIVSGANGVIKMADSGTTNFDCDVEVNSTAAGTIYSATSGSGKVYLKEGRKLSVGNDFGFSLGSLIFKNFIQEGTTPQTISLSCISNARIHFQPGCDFSGNLTAIAPLIYLQGGTFRGVSDFTICNSAVTNIDNVLTAPVLFKGDVYFRNTSPSNVWLGNGPFEMTFEGNASFYINNTGRLLLACGASNITTFAATDKKVSVNISSINNASAGAFYFATQGICNIKSDIEVFNNANATLTIGAENTGSVFLDEGKIISIPQGAFSYGNLNFRNFTQLGSTPQNFTLDGNINFMKGCDFGGNLTAIASIIYIQGGTFRGISDFTVNYNAVTNLNNILNAPVLFKGDVYYRNMSPSNVWLGNGPFDMTFEGNASFYINNTGRIHLALADGNTTTFAGTDKKVSVNISSINNATAGSFYFASRGVCTIKSNIEVLNNANATVMIGADQNGSVSLDEGKIISIPAGAFSFGNLYFKNFEQLGDMSQNLILTGSASANFSNGTIFNGDLSVISPRLMFNGGAKFKGISYFERTSPVGNDFLIGGNEFYKKVTFKNLGLQNFALCHSGGGDHYYDDVIFWNTTAAQFHASYTGTSQYDGNILFKNTGTGGVYIGWNGGVSNLASGKTVSAEGFDSGSLNIKNFKQTDASTAQNLTLPPNGTGLLNFSGGTEFWGDLTASAPGLAINGLFKGVCSFTKTGIGSHSGATAYFEKEVTFTNTGTGDILIGGTDFTFIDNVSLNNNNTGKIIVSHLAGQVTNFNGVGKLVKVNNLLTGVIYIVNNGICNISSNVELANLSTGGIYFSNGGGPVNLTSTCQITASDFNSGTLSFRGIKQEEGSPDINLDLQNARVVFNAGNVFYSNITVSCGYFHLNGSMFNGTVNLTSSNNSGSYAVSYGGNTFFSDLEITTSGTNGLMLAYSNGDIYKGNVTINKNSAEPVLLSRTGTSEFYRNISYNVISGQTPDAFGSSGGISAFMGDYPQSISSNYSSLVFAGGGIKMDKSSGDLTLSVPLNVTGNVTFVKGNVIASATNTFSFGNNSQVITGASDQSYIQGVARRFGNIAFTFPVGSGGKYMPISISKPSVNEDIRVEAFLDTPPNATTLNNTLSRISSCQYWDVQRVTGSSNISLTIPWASSGCEGINSRDISVAQYKNNLWQFFGANNIVTDGSNGSVTSNIPFTSGYYTFGYIPFDESVFGVLSNKMDGSIYPVKGQKINFRFLEQYKDAGSLKYKIYSNPSDLKDEGTITTSYGYNYESIELQTLGLSDGKLYILEVTDEKYRKSYLKFEFKNN